MKWLDLPPLWLVLFLAVTWASPWSVRFSGAFGLGLLCILIAGVLTAAALFEFRRARTTPVPHMQPSTLISSGVFRFTRNPIYLADLLILLGFTLIWGRLIGVLLLPVFLWVLTTRFVEPEEARLRDAFPNEFEDYAALTRRWF